MISIKPQRFAELINHSGRKPPPSVPPKILLISSQHAPSPPATPPKTQLVSSQHTSSPQVAPPKTRLVSSQHSSSVRFLSSHNAVQWLLSAVESGQATFKILPSWRNVLQPEHERVIARKIGLGAPVFVTDYYLAMKPFYMLRSNTIESREGPAASFGLLLSDICEVAGGSLREHRVESLLHSMRKHGPQNSSILEELVPNHKSYVVPPNKAANLDSSSRQERTPSSLHAQR